MPAPILTRPQLAARTHTMRSVLDTPWGVTAGTGGDPFAPSAAPKWSHLALEAELRRRDHAAECSEPLPLPVALAMVGRKVG